MKTWVADNGSTYNNEVTKLQVQLKHCMLHSSNNVKVLVINWWCCQGGENHVWGQKTRFLIGPVTFIGCKLKNQVLTKNPLFCTQTEPMVYRSNYKVAPSLPSFYSHSFKTIQTEPFLRARPPGAAHPHPDLFPGSETLASDGIGASAKPGHQTTPARHKVTSTVETCTMRKGRFFPTNKIAKAGWFSTEKQARTFCQWFFVALAAGVLSFHLLVCKQ